MYSNVYKTALKSDMGLQNLSVLCVSLIMGLGDDSGKDDKDNDNEISSNQSFTVMGLYNNIFFKWNDNDNKIFWAITHSDGTILELDISFHSCFSRLCVSCLPSCIQYKCPSKIQFNTDGLPSCIWYKCYGTPPGLKSAPSFCSLSSSFYPFILPSCPPRPHFYHLISLQLMMRMKMTMMRGHDMIYTNLLHMRKMVIQQARMTMVRSI